MIITIANIAAKSGVSIFSVSKVHNNEVEKFQTSKKIEKNIPKAVDESRYRSKQIARNLFNKSDSIAIVISNLSIPFFTYLTISIHKFTHKFGYSLIVCETIENLGPEIEHLELLLTKGIPGLIIIPIEQKNDHFKSVLQAGIPIVLLYICCVKLDACSILVDNLYSCF